MRNITIFALAAIASATTITPTVAQAAEPAAVTSIVHTADLDLSSNAGQRALDRRIFRAASDVCGTASEADLAGKNAVRRCRVDTVAQAKAQREQLLAAAKPARPIVVASAR